MYISQLNENTEGPRSTWCVSTTGTDECLCSVVAYRETVGRCRTSEKTTRHSACLASLCHVRRTRNTAIHCLPVAPDRQLPVQQRAAKYKQHLILTPEIYTWQHCARAQFWRLQFYTIQFLTRRNCVWLPKKRKQRSVYLTHYSLDDDARGEDHGNTVEKAVGPDI